ncbi:hypothetical protein EB093_02635 [bacterium]|nr:hypothetical protein [bacterium]
MGQKFQTEVENFYVSFSDLLSLLLIFFVYLFSMSSIDSEKYTQASESISQEFSSEQKNSGNMPYSIPVPPGGQADKRMRSAEGILVSKLKAQIESEKLDGQAKLEISPKSVKVVLSSPVLFASGSSDLSAEGAVLLGKFGPIIKQVLNPVVIEGFTDNVPIHNSRFDSNWELSFQRTLSVMRYFIDKFSFSPEQLSGTGFGQYRPLVPNTSDENRARNRRIEISIIRDYNLPEIAPDKVLEKDPPKSK